MSVRNIARNNMLVWINIQVKGSKGRIKISNEYEGIELTKKTFILERIVEEKSTAVLLLCVI